MENVILEEFENQKIKKIYILEEDLFNDESIKNFFKEFEWVYVNPELNISIKNDGFLLIKKESKIIDDFAEKNQVLKVYISNGLLQLNTDKNRISKNSYILTKNKPFNLKDKNEYLSYLINENKFKPSNTKLAKEIIAYILKDKLSLSYSTSEEELNIKKDVKKKNILIKDDLHNDNMIQYVKNTVKSNKSANIYYLFDKDRINNKIDISEEISSICNIIDTPQNSIELLEKFDELYVTKDVIGLEALMMEKTVYSLEESFYSGLGLTNDLYTEVSIKEKKITLEKLVYIMYEMLSINKKRKTGELLSSVELINFFEEIKNDQKIICLFNFPEELKVSMKGFFYHIHKLYFFDKGAQDIIENGLHKQDKTIELVIWENKEYPDLERYSKDKGVRLLRVNKGPIKTVYGEKENIFYSLYFDNKNLVVDSMKMTEMEEIFNLFKAEEHKKELEDSEKYLEIFNKNNISKISGLKEIDFKSEFNLNENHNKILIIGQDFDNDVAVSECKIGSNLELVKQIANENPNSEIFFKLDYVKIKNKEKVEAEYKEILNYARIINENISISSLYDSIDRIYTVSSILGLESLLRGKEVHCLGLPFYAGWGLTKDRLVKKTRTNKLSLIEMFYISYIFYPRYVNKNILETSDFDTTINDIIKHKSNTMIEVKSEIILDDLTIEKEIVSEESKELSFIDKIFNFFSLKKENAELKAKIENLESQLRKK